MLRRLAARQLSRRPAEAFIVIAGALLGTTMIVASLVVGDSLASVRQTAYDVLADRRPCASRRATSPNSVGCLDGCATSLTSTDAHRAPDPRRRPRRGPALPARVVVTELDFGQAARFGHRSIGPEVPDPGPRRVTTAISPTR